MSNTMLFTPYTFNNGITVNSRLAVAPLTLFSSNPDGTINTEEEVFLSSRAEHIGLYIQGATLVSKNGQAFPCQPKAISDEDLPSLRKRAEIIKKQGALSIVQLHHGGNLAVPELSGESAVSASAEGSVKELTEEQIQKIIADFAHATELCIQSGNDGIEIHGANMYLLQQFFSEKTNHRTDSWGGSINNRMKFALAVVDAVCEVKTRLNRPDFIIGYRLSPEEAGENGLTMTETIALVRALRDKPIQYLHVSQWNYYKNARRGVGAGTPRLKIIHDALEGKMPLIGVGSIFSEKDFKDAINSGLSEFVGIGKSIMMTPHLGTLLFEGRGSEIETELDLTKSDHYGIPATLWNMCSKAEDWLPPVKGKKQVSSGDDSIINY